LIDLPETQRQLLDAVAALRKPTTIVLTTGSAIAFDDSKANAVLLAWYYGQRGADAVADALLGETNPAGRLPITFYKDLEGMLPFDDYSMANRTYRYYSGKPLYAFGHGLSYTTFRYDECSLSKAKAKADDTVTLKLKVTNTGKRDGDEVVQVYLRRKKPTAANPILTLCGFRRVTIARGKTETVAIEVPVKQFRQWSTEKKRYVVEPGEYELLAGPSSDKLPVRVQLAVD
jgi:beta-glucosidase